MVLEEKIGPVRCAVRLRDGEAAFAEFDLPGLSKQHRFETGFDRQGMADALSISVKHIGFENHVPEVWSAGVPFLFVPVKDLGVLGEVEFDPALWEKIAPVAGGHLVSAYIYCRGGNGEGFHARMFSADMGIAEDPATGSAAAAFSGLIHRFDQLTDGHHQFRISQGVEMGRASLIHLHVDIQNGDILRARIGGQAIRFASGVLDL
jgi:trans-2,3-dihydro-3-hydroxyanthranilate isomerase